MESNYSTFPKRRRFGGGVNSRLGDCGLGTSVLQWGQLDKVTSRSRLDRIPN